MTGSVSKVAIVIPADVTLRSRALLTDADVMFYNLICLAVQDQYLVFARVPLWSIISIEGERKARSRLLRQIALKQLDFVLIHPGTKAAEQVVLIEDGYPPQVQEVTRCREIQSVLQSAGITLTTLKPQISYTVPQLAHLFGVGDEE